MRSRRASRKRAPNAKRGRSPSKARPPLRGCSSISATSWFTSSRKKRAVSTTSRVCGSMPSACRCPASSPSRRDDGYFAVSCLVVLAGGKVKEPGIRQAIDECLRRIHRHFPIQEVEVRDTALALAATLEKKLGAAAHVVVLDVAGKTMTSEVFARWLEARTSQGKGR